MINVFALPPLPEPLATIMRRPKPGETLTPTQAQMEVLSRILGFSPSNLLPDVRQMVDAARLPAAGFPSIPHPPRSAIDSFSRARSLQDLPKQMRVAMRDALNASLAEDDLVSFEGAATECGDRAVNLGRG